MTGTYRSGAIADTGEVSLQVSPNAIRFSINETIEVTPNSRAHDHLQAALRSVQLLLSASER